MRRLDTRSLSPQARCRAGRDHARGNELTFRYSLGGGRPASQFAALVTPAAELVTRCDRILVRARADHPLRLSVQLRASGTGDRRWQRSVYLDSTIRTAAVFFADMHAVGNEAAGPPPLGSIGSLLMLVDATNTAPGTSGEVTFSEIACAR